MSYSLTTNIKKHFLAKKKQATYQQAKLEDIKVFEQLPKHHYHEIPHIK